MKTIPILLSTLTLAASGGGVVLPMATQVVADQGVAMVADTSYNDILLGTNEFLDYVQISAINFDREVVDFAIRDPRSNWYVKRVMVVHRDYEGGISEAEADAKLVELGVGDDTSWAVTMLDRQVAGPGLLGMAYSAGMSKNSLVNNLTDQFYFALEFSEYETDESGKKVWGTETQWVRGKIDYRSCIHSSLFETVTTMQCAIVQDGDRYKTVPQRIADATILTLPVGERVLSWEDEWRAAQIERVQQATKQLQDVWNMLQSVTKLVDDATKIADRADMAIEEVGDNSGKQLARQLVALRNVILWVIDMCASLQEQPLLEENQLLTEQITQLVTEKVQLEQEKVTLVEERESLVGENKILEQLKTEVEAEKVSLMQENEDLRQKVAMLEKKLEEVVETKDENGISGDVMGSIDEADNKELVEKTETVVEQDTVSGTSGTLAQRDGLVEKQEVTESVETVAEQDEVNGEGTSATLVTRAETTQAVSDAQKVEIPDLGDREENQTKQWWWLPIVAALVALGGALGVIWAKLKRR